MNQYPYPTLEMPWDIYREINPNLLDAEMPDRAIAMTPAPTRGVQAQAMPQPLNGLTPRAGETQLMDRLGQESGQRGSGSSSKALFMTPDEYNARIALATESAPIKAQQLALDQNRALFRKQLSHPQTLDLATPLANLADSFSTGHLGTRVSPNQHGDAAAKIREWAKQLQDDQRDLTRSILDSVKASKLGMDQEQYQQWLVNKALEQAATPNIGGSRSGVNRDAIDVDRFVKTFQNSPNVRPLNDAINSARDIASALEKPSWLSDKNVRAFMVEAARLKPVSDSDRIQYNGPADLLSRANRMFERLISGKEFLPEDRQTILEYTSIMARKHEAARDELKKEYATKIGPAYRYSERQALGYLGFTSPTIRTGQGAKAPEAPQSTKGDPGMEAFLKNRKR